MGNNQASADALKWDNEQLLLVSRNDNENRNNENFIYWNNTFWPEVNPIDFQVDKLVPDY